MTPEDLDFFNSVKKLGNIAMDTFIESIDDIMEKLSPEDKMKLTTNLLSVYCDYQKNLCLLIENSKMQLQGQSQMSMTA